MVCDTPFRPEWLTYRPDQKADGVDLSSKDAFLTDVQVAVQDEDSRPLSCIMADIDHFKSVNDQFGHSAGDKVLSQVATTIRGAVGFRGKCYRFGGEEISVLLPCFSELEAAAVAERLRRCIADESLGPGMPEQVTISFGVAELVPGEPAQSAWERADKALYRAKTMGRNRVETASGEVLGQATKRSRRTKQEILVVDDDRFIRDILSDFLELEGFKAIRMEARVDALNLTEPPDAVIVAVDGKNLSGLAIIRALQRQYESPKCIAMASTWTSDLAAKVLEEGASLFIEKPFKMEKVIHEVKRLVGPARR